MFKQSDWAEEASLSPGLTPSHQCAVRRRLINLVVEKLFAGTSLMNSASNLNIVPVMLTAPSEKHQGALICLPVAQFACFLSVHCVNVCKPLFVFNNSNKNNNFNKLGRRRNVFKG